MKCLKIVETMEAQKRDKLGALAKEIRKEQQQYKSDRVNET